MSKLWNRFARDRLALAALVSLMLIVSLAVLAPLLAPSDPWKMAGRPFTPPFRGPFILGTDSLGRDILSGLIYGARITLLVGAVSTAAAVLVGVTLGALAGFVGGLLDTSIMRLVEFFQTIPSFIFAILLVAIFQPSFSSVISAIALVTWGPIARLARAEFVVLRHREYVAAAVAAGRTPLDVAFREILPNALPPLIVMASLGIATAVLLESAISFLGLGDPNLISWGYMVGAGRTVLREAWWISVFPGLAILVTVLAVNLVGEGLNAALSPKLHLGRAG